MVYETRLAGAPQGSVLGAVLYTIFIWVGIIGCHKRTGHSYHFRPHPCYKRWWVDNNNNNSRLCMVELGAGIKLMVNQKHNIPYSVASENWKPLLTPRSVTLNCHPQLPPWTATLNCHPELPLYAEVMPWILTLNGHLVSRHPRLIFSKTESTVSSFPRIISAPEASPFIHTKININSNMVLCR